MASDAIANVVRVANEIEGGSSLRVTQRRDRSAERRAATLAALAVPRIVDSPGALRSAIGLVSTADWLGQMETLLEHMESQVAKTRAAARLAWWR